jgi:hypothetical protein
MENTNQVVYLKGVDENYRYVTGVADHLIVGEYDLGTKEIPKLILGAGVGRCIRYTSREKYFYVKNLFTQEKQYSADRPPGRYQ